MIDEENRMVDFTRVINNADMVESLNELIHHNMSLLACFEDNAPRLENQNSQLRVRELKKLHYRHARLLSDTVRELGGAPDYGTESKFYWIGKSKMWLGKWRRHNGVLKAVREEEEKLQAHYKKSLQSLMASPESAVVIVQVMEEQQAQLQRLQ